MGSLNSLTARASCVKDNFTSCRVGNPTVVWDSASAEVVLAYVVRGFGPGEDAIGAGIIRSADGKTWGKPTDHSVGFEGETGSAGMPGPGTALQLDTGPKKGRLFVASQHGYVTVAVSDDGGNSSHTKTAVRQQPGWCADAAAERQRHDQLSPQVFRPWALLG